MSHNRVSSSTNPTSPTLRCRQSSHPQWSNYDTVCDVFFFLSRSSSRLTWSETVDLSFPRMRIRACSYWLDCLMTYSRTRTMSVRSADRWHMHLVQIPGPWVADSKATVPEIPLRSGVREFARIVIPLSYGGHWQVFMSVSTHMQMILYVSVTT